MSKTTPDDVCALCYHHKSEAATCNREDCELSSASPCSADFDAEKKAIEFQELFFPKAGKLVRTAVRFSFAQGFRMAQKQNVNCDAAP